MTKIKIKIKKNTNNKIKQKLFKKNDDQYNWKLFSNFNCNTIFYLQLKNCQSTKTNKKKIKTRKSKCIKKKIWNK